MNKSIKSLILAIFVGITAQVNANQWADPYAANLVTILKNDGIETAESYFRVIKTFDLNSHPHYWPVLQELLDLAKAVFATESKQQGDVEQKSTIDNPEEAIRTFYDKYNRDSTTVVRKPGTATEEVFCWNNSPRFKQAFLDLAREKFEADLEPVVEQKTVEADTVIQPTEEAKHSEDIEDVYKVDEQTN